MTDTIDLTPSPRVLRMLGEIDFKAWQCLCEIIDNSIDSFSNLNIDDATFRPTVKIKLPAPSANQVKTSDQLIIEDNGAGMTIDDLNKSLKAGFSGNNPVDKMGLFGMGFNISTARLGNRTEIYTSTKDSDFFYKATIDFQELESKGHFNAPIERIQKRADEQNKHGTKIIITKLRTDHVRPLYQRKKISEKLGKIYGRIIRNLDIKLQYDGQRCRPFKHCVWSEGRHGQSSNGPVPAIINIDKLIDTRKYCATCWVWLSDMDDSCPSCGENSAISNRERRVKGWLGIQRYFHADHYGIDLIRNGRVITELDKSFFYWINNDEEPELEYPIDGHQRLGRIVGELEIDFVKVTHQKDAFDKNTQDWKDVVLCVRGDGPIRPKVARSQGFVANESPLARLFSAFRKTSAGVRNLVPQRKNGQAMITDPLLDEMVRKFYDGITDYQGDDKWWQLLNEASPNEQAKRGETDPSGGDPFSIEDKNGRNESYTPEQPKDYEEENSSPAGIEEEATEPDIFLSKNYSIDLFRNINIRVVAERALKGKNDDGFRVSLKGVELYFTYWPKSKIFIENFYTPADFLINELAYHIHSVAQSEVAKIPISAVELAIREKYFSDLFPSVSELDRQVRMFCDDLSEHLRENVDTLDIAIDHLNSAEISGIKLRMAQNEGLGENEIDEAIRKGEFLSYAPFSIIRAVASRNYDTVFDGEFFKTSVSNGTDKSELIKVQKKEFESILDDIVWFLDNARQINSKLWKARARRLIGSIEILNSWRA